MKARAKEIMPPIQYWFTGTALATFIAVLAAVSTLGYGWYRAAITEMESTNNKIASEASKKKTEQVKRLLGEALASGGKLIGAQAEKNDDECENDANAWGSKAHSLIDYAYGDGEALLFLDSSGYVFYGDGSKKSNVRNWIDGRMRRITKLRRTDSLVVKSEFDPTKFE
jgi:hypothetical protein